jgi:hypothetical protein
MLSRRAFVRLAGSIAAAPLVGCGASEDEQARAFADFLQRRILDRPGVHVPILNAEESAAIGHYVSDYAVLERFNNDVDATLSKVGAALRPFPRDITPLELPDYRDYIVAGRDFANEIVPALDSALARAGESHAKLKQPDIVKAKYEAAYDQFITRPAAALRAAGVLMSATADAEFALVDFVAAHRADLTMAGDQIQASTLELHAQLQPLLANWTASVAKANEARGAYERVMLGN